MLELLCVLLLSLVLSSPAQSQSATLVIDGRLDDAIWRNIPAERLVPSEAGVPAETGGEIRIAIVGRYLCLAARLPELTGRITARLTGINPSWEDEDVLRIVAGADIGYTDRILQVNPLGAYSVEKALHITNTELAVYPYSLERRAQTIYNGAHKFLVATTVGEKEWTVEAAIPLNELSAPGRSHILASVERVRALRPGSSQQKWHWPKIGPASRIPFSTSIQWDAPAPLFRPVPLGNKEPPLEVGRTRRLPPLDSGWDDAAWRDTPVWKLVRDEAVRREPRFPTEVKALHDGSTLAVLARCVEPGTVVARVKENNGPLGGDDSFHVYLAASGSMYAQFAVNAASYLLDTVGFSGGERLSRAREWNSGARVLARRQAGEWTARMDIPLDPVARTLGETVTPSAWRVLFLRSRPGRDEEPPERSVLPVIQSDTAVCPARYRGMALRDVEPARLAKPQPESPPTGLAALDGRVLSSEQRKEFRLATMVDENLRARVRRSVEAEQRDWEQVKTRSNWELFRDPRIKALAASMGKFPARMPLQTRVTKEFVGYGYVRKDLIYQSRPGLWVTANLYLPGKLPARMPGIVIVHSHHRPRTQAELQDMGILWARAGCAVLIMDQIGHGERLQTYPWNREAYHSRYVMGMQLYLAGESLLSWMVWDVMRGIDLLLERKDVNPERIILLGAVAAGGEPAAVTAALDSRVAAVAPFGFNEVNPGWGEWESTRSLRRSIVDQFFPWLIGASVAPRRFIYAKEMGWETYRHTGLARIEKVFALYGVPDNLDRAHGFGTFPGPGECANIGPSQRATMYPELDRWFGIPIPASEPDDRRPEEELAALNSATTSQLEMRTIHDLARETAEAKLKGTRREMQTLQSDARREWLKAKLAAKLGDIEPNPNAPAVVRWNKRLAGAEIEGITVESEHGILVPLLLLRPADRVGARLPVVAAVAQGGKELFLSQRSAEIESLLKNGDAVCLVDVRGTGETSPEARRGRNSEEESPAATEFMLGSTLLGARLKDLRTAVLYLARRKDLDAEHIAIWGDSFSPVNPPRLVLDETTGWQMGPELQQQAEPLGGLLALLGALYEDRIRAMAVRRGLAAYLSVLDDQFTYVPNDIIVPGILEVGDLNDVVAALGPRPLLLQSLVDGRNRLVSEEDLRRQYSGALESYQSSPQNLVIRREQTSPTLVEWLIAQLRTIK
jgi:Acetyl xylan esterase (AXE1)